MITIPIAADHAGYELKQVLIKYLMDKGYHIEDLGTHSTKSMDYPDAIHPLDSAINEGTFAKLKKRPGLARSPWYVKTKGIFPFTNNAISEINGTGV